MKKHCVGVRGVCSSRLDIGERRAELWMGRSRWEDDKKTRVEDEAPNIEDSSSRFRI